MKERNRVTGQPSFFSDEHGIPAHGHASPLLSLVKFLIFIGLFGLMLRPGAKQQPAETFPAVVKSRPLPNPPANKPDTGAKVPATKGTPDVPMRSDRIPAKLPAPTRRKARPKAQLQRPGGISAALASERDPLKLKGRLQIRPMLPADAKPRVTQGDRLAKLAGTSPVDAVTGARMLHRRGQFAFSPAARPIHRIKKMRFIGVQIATLAGGIYSFHKFNQFFGGIAQPFRIGNDWNKDHALHADELLHFQGSYRLAQGIADLYRWTGVRPGTARWIGVGAAISAMTFLEYIDGRRKDDEASYSDLVANLLGVSYAYLRPHVPLLQYFDFHISYRGITDPLKSRKLLNYDRLTHWLVVDMKKLAKWPVEVGVGYGVKNAFTPRAHPKVYLGVGVGLGKLLRQHRDKLPGPLRWMDVYQLGMQLQIL